MSAAHVAEKDTTIRITAERMSAGIALQKVNRADTSDENAMQSRAIIGSKMLTGFSRGCLGAGTPPTTVVGCHRGRPAPDMGIIIASTIAQSALLDACDKVDATDCWDVAHRPSMHRATGLGRGKNYRGCR